jgi:hypothetical protein
MTNLPPHRPTARGHRPVRDRRARERRALVAGLTVSLILHLLLVAVAVRFLDPEIEYVTSPRETTAAEPVGLRAVTIARGEAAPEDPPMGPIEQPAAPVAPPSGAPAPAPPPPADAAPPGERPGAAQRLTPRMVDPRLWRPMIVLPRQPSFDDVQDRVAAAIEMLSDSALAEVERAARARDWTVEDASGGRWGVSPGQLHLGSVTLPIPLHFPVDLAGLGHDAQWYELETQLERAEFLENFDTRVRAVRERRDRERTERRAAGIRGGG